MRKTCLFTFLILLVFAGHSQNKSKTALKLDSLRSLLQSNPVDTTAYNALIEIGNLYQAIKPDSALVFYDNAVGIAKKIKNEFDRGEAIRLKGVTFYFYLRNAEKAVACFEEAAQIAEKELRRGGDKRIAYNAKKLKAAVISMNGVMHKDKGDHPKALELFSEALKINTEAGNIKGQINNYGNLGLTYYNSGQPEKALENHLKALKLSEQINSKINISTVAGNIGLVYRTLGDQQKALEYYNKALKTDEEQENKNGVARHLGNISAVYKEQGDPVRALEYCFKGLKLAEELQDKKNMGSIYGSIAIIYNTQLDYRMAEMYYKKALKAYEEIGDRLGISIQLGNIGIVYMQLGDSARDKGNKEFAAEKYKLALDHYERAQRIDEEIHNLNGIASNFGNIGGVYKSMGQLEKALEYHLKALKISEETGSKQAESVTTGNIGNTYILLNKPALAEKYLQRSLDIGKEIGSANEIKYAHECFFNLYERTKQPALALEHYKLFIQYRDSLFNEANTRATMQQEIKFGYEKKAAADSVKTAEEKKVINAQLKAEKTERYALYGGLVLVALFSMFMVNRFRVTNRQKKIIEEQKEEVEMQKEVVEEKQKEILDSIHYAKRIQSALMPNEKYIHRNIRELQGKG